VGRSSQQLLGTLPTRGHSATKPRSQVWRHTTLPPHQADCCARLAGGQVLQRCRQQAWPGRERLTHAKPAQRKACHLPLSCSPGAPAALSLRGSTHDGRKQLTAVGAAGVCCCCFCWLLLLLLPPQLYTLIQPLQEAQGM
jgi:hypothetical protein